jgi:hypothetical protein
MLQLYLLPIYLESEVCIATSIQMPDTTLLDPVLAEKALCPRWGKKLALAVPYAAALWACIIYSASWAAIL